MSEPRANLNIQVTYDLVRLAQIVRSLDARGIEMGGRWGAILRLALDAMLQEIDDHLPPFTAHEAVEFLAMKGFALQQIGRSRDLKLAISGESISRAASSIPRHETMEDAAKSAEIRRALEELLP